MNSYNEENFENRTDIDAEKIMNRSINEKIERSDELADINAVIDMIDGRMSSGVGRLKVRISEELEAGTVSEQYHHGRCDVGSPWAKGTAPNCDYVDVPQVNFMSFGIDNK